MRLASIYYNCLKCGECLHFVGLDTCAVKEADVQGEAVAAGPCDQCMTHKYSNEFSFKGLQKYRQPHHLCKLTFGGKPGHRD